MWHHKVSLLPSSCIFWRIFMANIEHQTWIKLFSLYIGIKLYIKDSLLRFFSCPRIEQENSCTIHFPKEIIIKLNKLLSLQQIKCLSFFQWIYIFKYCHWLHINEPDIFKYIIRGTSTPLQNNLMLVFWGMIVCCPIIRYYITPVLFFI